MTTTGLSYLLSARVRDATLHVGSTPPALVLASPSEEPAEITFSVRVREAWNR